MSGTSKNQSNQRGMVSFMVVLIMMLVITLIVIGFLQVTRRNAREALDRQLSTEAFYAAESGINATQVSLVNYSRIYGTSALATKTTCAYAYDPNPSHVPSTVIQPLAPGVTYTCVLVDPTPSSLQFAADQQGSSITNLYTKNNLNGLTIDWTMQSGGSKTACAGASNYSFPPVGLAGGQWGADCDFGVLRLDIVSDIAVNSINSTSLSNNTVTVFLTPRGDHSGAGTITFGGGTSAYVISGMNQGGGGACTSGTCEVHLSLPNNTANYDLRASTIYKDTAKVTVTGQTDNGGATFYGTQAVVDVTGQAQDELRRIQTRVSLNGTAANTPTNALAGSSGVCKYFHLTPTDTINAANLCTGP